MQLRYLILFSFLSPIFLFSQEEDTAKIHLDDIEINWMFSYYEQDGAHSPVTGGIGTEQLNNFAPNVNFVVPITEKQTLKASWGMDFYSSASSDNIDNPFKVADHVTGASSNDFRTYGTLGFEQKNKKKNTTYEGGLSTSFEYDVKSIGFSGGYSKTGKNNNRTFSINGSYLYDKWKLIYPIELRNGQNELVTEDTRQSINLSPSYSFVINKKMRASFTADLTYQFGLLSTPFHRVYTNDIDTTIFENFLSSKVEKLPSSRFKFPIAANINISLTDFLLLKGSYRFYYDNWGVLGNTLRLEVPIKIKNFMRLYPFYRFHIQSAADYFAPFGVHESTTTYYTSDFDLSALHSHKMGLGISIAPLYGIFRFNGAKQKVHMLKNIDFRYAHYRRSDGLTANIFTLGFSYRVQR